MYLSCEGGAAQVIQSRTLIGSHLGNTDCQDYGWERERCFIMTVDSISSGSFVCLFVLITELIPAHLTQLTLRERLVEFWMRF